MFGYQNEKLLLFENCNYLTDNGIRLCSHFALCWYVICVYIAFYLYCKIIHGRWPN